MLWKAMTLGNIIMHYFIKFYMHISSMNIKLRNIGFGVKMVPTMLSRPLMHARSTADRDGNNTIK